MLPIPELLESFNKNPAQSRQRLVSILETDGSDAVAQGLAVLSMMEQSRGAEFFIGWLIERGELFPALCNSDSLSLDEATTALKVAMRIAPGCDIEYFEQLAESVGDTAALTRMMDLVSKTRVSSRLTPILTNLRQHPNPFLQSKAELLLKRVEQASELLKRRLADPDPRTRADALESLWGEATPEAREAFREAARSPHNRVAGNGLYGMYLAGEAACIPLAFDLAENQSPMIRPTAIWFMGETGDPRFLPWLADAMGTKDERERTQIFQAIRRIRDRRIQVVASGRLHVHLQQPTVAGDERVLRFSVVSEAGVVQKRIAATQVVITEGTQTIAEFAVRSEAMTGALSLIVALPADGDLQVDRDSLVRPPDSFQTARYENEVRFERLSGRSFHTRSSQKKDDLRREIVLVGHGKEVPLVPDMPSQIEWLRLAGVRVHTVFPEHSSGPTLLQLEAVARGSSGFAVRYEDSSAAALEQIVTALVQPFEAKYRIRGREESLGPQVQLQIYGPYGFGESSTVLVHNAD